MNQSEKSKRRDRLASSLTLAIAVLARLLLAAAPLHAAEQPHYVQPKTPLETAQRFEALTEGGLFNPVQVTPFDETVSQFGRDAERDRQGEPTSSDREMQ